MVTQSQYDLAVEMGNWLRQKSWRMVTAESCTGGGVGYAISAVPGSSEWLAGGFITYSNALKEKLLGVPPEILHNEGAVSAATAEAMAAGARKAAGVDIAVAVTGVAGPTGGTTAKPIGLVWFGLSWEGGVCSWKQQFPGDREAVRDATIEEALRCFEKIT
ncbi:CinA family protein [Pseudidiomarina insulisalsae]|uniref:Damage-inducible protein CinA n=1 Tax=Pseudidiomarina insulisalsae TaxID=575789 RepID=A0A432YA51_9GAMM|nr:CinA family protein [Pseudidiomarina insulisalsae]RUO57859.1 damage-inducible protein CinA [Pseudidiomarina insulisalsae]